MAFDQRLLRKETPINTESCLATVTLVYNTNISQIIHQFTAIYMRPNVQDNYRHIILVFSASQQHLKPIPTASARCDPAHGIGHWKPPLHITGHASVRKEGHESTQEAGKRQEMAWPESSPPSTLPYMPALGWAVRMLHFTRSSPIQGTAQTEASLSQELTTQSSLQLTALWLAPLSSH